MVGDFHIDEQEVARFIAADIDDKAAVVIVESFAGGDHASLIEAAEPIVSSITSP